MNSMNPQMPVAKVKRNPMRKTAVRIPTMVSPSCHQAFVL